jgi:hypothetical protein
MESEFFHDSEWAGDLKTRINVIGFIVYLMNEPVCWISKAKRGVTLSSGIYLNLWSCQRKIKFIYFLVPDIVICVELPIVVKTENFGAMFMANVSTGVRKRHVDIRYHFIRENNEDGTIKIEFVRPCDNISDIFTKNVNQETYARHVKKFLGKGKTGSWTFWDRKGIENNPHAWVI